MQKNISPEYTIEIDIDRSLCELDQIQEITFEFFNSNFFLQKLTDGEKVTYKRIVDIDLNELVGKNEKVPKEICAKINGQDTIIKTLTGSNHMDEIDILQMDDELLIEDLPKSISFNDQMSSQSQM